MPRLCRAVPRRNCRSFCGSRNQISGTDSSARPRCAILHARGQRSETTMRNPILAIAIVFVLAPCVALAQSPSLSFGKIQQEYKPQKDDGTLARDAQSGLPTGKRMHKPYTVTKQVGSASPNLTTQNKPPITTVNPALQGNALEKGEKGVGSPPPPRGYDLKANPRM